MGTRLSAGAWRDAQNRLNDLVHYLAGSQGAFRVHYWGASPGLLSNRPHKHSFFEVCCCMSGEGTYHEENRQWTIREGTMFCSRPGVAHQITVGPDGKLYVLFVGFEPETDGAPGAEAHRTANAPCAAAALEGAYKTLSAADRLLWVDDADDTAAAHLWEALLREAAAPASHSSAPLHAIAYALIASFPQLFAPELLRPGRVNARAPAQATHGLVKQAKLLMRDNLVEPLRLAHVADHLHVSVRHLSRLFHEQQGESIGEWLRGERVRLGAQLLADRGLSIKEIAERTGLGSVHYFTRVFAKEMGMPPAAYRKLQIITTSDPDNFT